VGNAVQVKQTNQVGLTYPGQIVWSTDGSTFGVLWTNNSMPSSSVNIYDARTLSQKSTYTIEDGANLLALSPDNKTIAVSKDNGVTIELRDAASGASLRTINAGGSGNIAAFSTDGKQLGVISMDQWAVTLWDVNSGQTLKTLTGFETAAPVYNAVFGDDGKTLLWHARATVQTQDIGSGAMGKAFSHEDFVNSFAISRDGSKLFTATAATVDGNYSPVVVVWDVASGNQLALLVNPDPVSVLAVSADGRLVAAGSGNNIILWDVNAKAQLATLKGNSQSISYLAFSPDGRTLVSSCADGSVRLWQAVLP
jgi:WD40 repeat protein